jgi:hypothetical protein
MEDNYVLKKKLYDIQFFWTLEMETTRRLSISYAAIWEQFSLELPNSIVHPSSIYYIQNLLLPYAEELDLLNNQKDIWEWIWPRFHRETVRRITESLSDTENVILLRNEVIDQLVFLIIGNVSDQVNTVDILPWSVQDAVMDDELLNSLPWNIGDKAMDISGGYVPRPNTRKLEVSILLRGKGKFTDSFTEEFTIGLLLFSKISGFIVYIGIFMSALDSDYFLRDGEDRLTKYNYQTEDSRYMVTVGESVYAFSTNDFMQGFATGASWLGVDHHDYWSNLMMKDAGGWKEITL